MIATLLMRLGFSLFLILIAAALGFLVRWAWRRNDLTVRLGASLILVPSAAFMLLIAGIFINHSSRLFLGQAFVSKGNTFTVVAHEHGMSGRPDLVTLKREDGEVMPYKAFPTVSHPWDQLLLSKRINEVITKEEILQTIPK